MSLIDADALDMSLAEAQSECKKRGGNFRFGVLSNVRVNIADAPTIDAIPVEWLRQYQSRMPNTAAVMGVDMVLKMWQEKQEAQDG